MWGYQITCWVCTTEQLCAGRNLWLTQSGLGPRGQCRGDTQSSPEKGKRLSSRPPPPEPRLPVPPWHSIHSSLTQTPFRGEPQPALLGRRGGRELPNCHVAICQSAQAACCRLPRIKYLLPDYSPWGTISCLQRTKSTFIRNGTQHAQQTCTVNPLNSWAEYSQRQI